jgi:hypothetical protein
MQINFQGQYDRDLFFKAVRLANQPAKNRGRLMLFMLLIAAGALAVLLYRVFSTGDLEGNLIYIAAVVMMGGVAGFDWLRPYFAAHKLWRNPGVRRALEGQINSQAIVYLLPEGKNAIPWEQFTRLRKSEALVTLVRRDGLLVIFPRRFFKNQADWRRFNQWVDGKFTQPKDRAAAKH